MSKTKITKRQQQAIETHKKIYNTTMALAAKYGLHTLSISDICKEAGVSVGAFYNHYKSLDFIIIEGYRYDKYIETRIEQEPLIGTSSQKICRLFQYKMEFIIDFGVEFMIQLFKSHLDQVRAENNVFLNKNRIMPVLLQKLLEEGKESHELEFEITSEKLVHLLLIYSRGIMYDWCIRNGNYDLIEITKTAIGLYMNQFEAKSH